MRIHFSLFLLLFIMQSGAAQSLTEASEALASSKDLRDGSLSFYAVNLESGDIVVDYNINHKMSPASTLKLLTTYAALDILGPEFRYQTRVGYTGAIDEQGRLVGDIVIEGKGDPALDSERFAEDYGSGTPSYRQILAAVREAGIRSIAGRIVIDERWYTGIDVPDEYTWQDMGNYYAAGAHAFTFAENKVVLEFKSGKKVGADTELQDVSLDIPGLRYENHVKGASIRSDQAYVYSSPRSELMTIHGEIPLSKSGFKVKASIPNPAKAYTSLLSSNLRMAGIEVNNEDLGIVIPRDPDGGIDVRGLVMMESPKLIDLVAYTNMKSNNLFAEHFLRQIGKVKGSEGSYKEGIKAVNAWLAAKGIDRRGLLLKDGSGLSRANNVSARFMVDLIQSLATEPYYAEYRNALPTAGESGSMRRVGAGTSIASRMFAKTGYIEGARGYAGVLTKAGGDIAFCILANDYDLSASEMRKAMAKLLVLLDS